MIELKHLKTLLALEAAGSVATAAIQLHQTQSALSHQLSDIEQRLGYRLFIRKSYPLHFTTQGNILLNLAKSVLPDVHQALHACQKPDCQLVRFALESHSCLQWLTPVFNYFRTQRPDIQLDFIASLKFDAQPALQQNDVDLVLTSEILPNSGLKYIPLFDYEIKIALAKTHPLASKTRLIAEDLAKELLLVYPIVRQRIDVWHRYLQPAGVSPCCKTVDNTLLVIEMVAANMGIAALPDWVIANFQQHAVVSRSLSRPLYSRLYAAVRENEKNQPAIQAFIDSFSPFFQQLP